MKTFFLAFSVAFQLVAFSQDLSVARIWKNYEFSAKYAGAYQALNDGQHYTEFIKEQGLVKGSILNPSEAKEILIAADQLMWKGKAISVDGYELNSNETKALIWTATTPIYRRSFEAFYFLYDLQTKKLSALDEVEAPQTLAEYSPDGTMVSFIHGNDLFVKNVLTGKLTKITQDGKHNKIINGTTDWVYEEEFAITKAYAWSPDSKYIAFLRFDEREVPEFNLAMYGQLYPTEYTYKYPKAGEVNSVVTLHLAAVKSGKIQQVSVGEYEYIPRLKWSAVSNQLVVQTMNRHQNQLNYWLVNCNSSKVVTACFFTEKSDTYVEVDDNLLILKDGQSILRTSEQSGYNHIYRLGFDGKTSQITNGNWDVIAFLGIDENSNTIYFTSAEQNSINKGLYAIGLDGSAKRTLSTQIGTNDADFLNGMHYYIHTFSTANTPPVTSLCRADGSVVRILEDNAALLQKMAQERLTQKTFMRIQTPETTLNAWVMLPTNFDPAKKYPVFVNVYGGPGHNEVLDAWDGNDYFFHQLLTQKGYIVLTVDPRGTLYQGAAFKKATYLQLGKLEIQDVMDAVKAYSKNSFVDPTRIGIMGWSYGGFMASLAMTKGADVFKTGIAVAPVTNWRYYDNIYTERFMRTPAENAAGYDQNSPINFADQLKGNFLLIHGAADDNVHYQNSMDFISALVKANKQFDLFIYPNKNHGIYGGNTRNHLFTMVYNYILENL
ncbi:MAG: hypothetical protein RLZZ301_1523 [Bacteroidota bacterium]|jgi:dipeptidyl-peptidase-4